VLAVIFYFSTSLVSTTRFFSKVNIGSDRLQQLPSLTKDS